MIALRRRRRSRRPTSPPCFGTTLPIVPGATEAAVEKPAAAAAVGRLKSAKISSSDLRAIVAAAADGRDFSLPSADAVLAPAEVARGRRRLSRPQLLSRCPFCERRERGLGGDK